MTGANVDLTYLVDVAEGSRLNTRVLDNLAQDTAIATTDNQDLLGVGVGVHGQMGDHLLVRELIALRDLDGVVQDEDLTIGLRLENQDVLVLALLVVEHLLDLEGHGLACSSR